MKKNKISFFLSILSLSLACEIAVAGNLVFQPQFTSGSVTPTIVFSNVEGAGYLGTKNCQADNLTSPASITCDPANPNVASSLSANFTVGTSPQQSITFTSGGGQFSSSAVSPFTYTDNNGNTVTCSVSNLTGGGNAWTLPFTCTSVAVSTTGYGVAFSLAGNSGLVLSAPQISSFNAVWAYQDGTVSISNATSSLYSLTFQNTTDNSAFLAAADSAGITYTINFNGGYSYPILITKQAGQNSLTVAQGANVNLPAYTTCSPVITGAGTSEAIALTCTTNAPVSSSYTYNVNVQGDSSVKLQNPGSSVGGATWSNTGSMAMTGSTSGYQLAFNATASQFANTGETAPFAINFSTGDAMIVYINKKYAADGLLLQSNAASTITLTNGDSCSLPAGAVSNNGTFTIQCTPPTPQTYSYILQSAAPSGLPAGVNFNFSSAKLSNVTGFSGSQNVPQSANDTVTFNSATALYPNLAGNYTVTVPLTGTSSSNAAVAFNVVKTSGNNAPTIIAPTAAFTSQSGLLNYTCSGAQTTASNAAYNYNFNEPLACTSTVAVNQLNYDVNFTNVPSNYLLTLSGSNLITNAPSWLGVNGDINFNESMGNGSATVFATVPNNDNYYSDAGTFTLNMVVTPQGVNMPAETIPLTVTKAAGSLNLTVAAGSVSFNNSSYGQETYSWPAATINPITGASNLNITYAAPVQGTPFLFVVNENTHTVLLPLSAPTQATGAFANRLTTQSDGKADNGTGVIAPSVGILAGQNGSFSTAVSYNGQVVGTMTVTYSAQNQNQVQVAFAPASNSKCQLLGNGTVPASTFVIPGFSTPAANSFQASLNCEQ